ncbi:hypothetical protein HUK80_01510 [Flavobacterium sp. MAH-1]|uniref:Microcystin-dependent protein n=1 Tax=Flavobacterium agri TaxID=2743471 RepID=A0A7Y8XZD0_9FLAO|nr:hypothetical protein [Flavobacterium agri]NUY79555.1 hypothetical protein [Flavobacterium agri]NYA69580.1 hypothetical protein [Flavobacterium agri]
MKTTTLIVICLALLPMAGVSQVLISDFPPNSEPQTDAVLELRSLNKDKGLLLPKVALVAANNPSPMSAHVQGMTVYNTQVSGVFPNRVEPGLYYNDGTSWKHISTNAPTIGDIKSSALASDHDGWYLLNGRVVTALPVAAHAYAQGLGFASNLPNGANRFLKGKTDAEILGSSGGSAGIVIAQENFPEFMFTATLGEAGLHNHSYNDRASGTGMSAEGGAIQTVADNVSVADTTGISGDHSHSFSVNTGGNGTPIPFKPPYMASNLFIYLGSN